MLRCAIILTVVFGLSGRIPSRVPAKLAFQTCCFSR